VSGETHRIGGTGGDAGNPSMMAPWQEAWQRIRAKLRAEFGDATFDSWLKPLGVLRAEGSKVLITVPTRFMCDWVKTHYLGRITDYWRQETGAAIDVELVVSVQASMPTPPAPQPAVVKPASRPARAEADDLDAAGDPYCAPLDPRFTFDSFVVGKSNELAHAAARRVAGSPKVQFNPLFLYGGVGLGKTHLMHAIAAEIRARNPERRVLYMSAEKFMYQFIRALRYKDTMAFKEQFRSVDVLMIDDVQFIAHKDSTQEEFFHTFNAVIDQHRQVVISGDRSPSDLDGIEDRIKSRLGWGLVADVHPTDYELRVGILQSKLEMMGRMDMPKEVTEFLARKIVSNVRELEGALNRVTAYSDLVGRPVTLEMTQEVLQDLIRSNDRRVSIAEIQRHVAEYFNVRLSDLLSARRARAVARPRQVAMYLAKQLTSRSLPEIGRKFGGRDHTTVMHAVRRIEELRETDSSLDQDIENLRRTLET
jgi:chromosomal replication initiator protein